MFTVPSPQGNGSISGLLAKPAAAGKYPAVLVVHENRGLNPYIEDVARRLATANFLAVAPDGLVEAVSHRADLRFLLGVQWHPEWRFRENRVSSAIFRAFGEAAREEAVRRAA